MVHNPAHELFSIGNFLCRVRVVDCCDLRNGAETTMNHCRYDFG